MPVGATTGVAQRLVRRWIHVMHHLGWLLEEIFHDFLRDWVDSTLEVDSRRFSPCTHGRRGSGRARRQQWQWHAFSWFCLCWCTSRGVPDDCRQSAEKCTVDFSLTLEMHLEICILFQIFYEPLYLFSMFSVEFLRESIFGALEHSPVSARGLGGGYQSCRPVLHN